MRGNTSYINSTRGTYKTFVTTNIYRDKHVFVARKVLSRQTRVRGDKTRLLSWQNYASIIFVATKRNFVATNVLLSRQNTCFVVTNTCLSRQTRVCRDKNYTCSSSRQWYISTFLAPALVEESCVGSVQKDLMEDLLAGCLPFVLVANTSCPVCKLISASAWVDDQTSSPLPLPADGQKDWRPS